MVLNDRFIRAFHSSVAAQMLLILIVGLLAAQSASTWLQWSERVTVASQMRSQCFADHIVQTVHVLENTGSSKRSTVLSGFPIGPPAR